MKKIKEIKVLFIGAGEPTASSRYRAEQYVEYNNLLRESRFIFTFFAIQPPLEITKKRHIFLLLMLFRKLYSLIFSIKYDIVFLQRNPVKVLSPYYEWVMKFILRKKIIFDFDDNLWVIDGGYDKRIDAILKIADMVIVGNQYLQNRAMQFNKKTKILPTVIDSSPLKATSDNKDYGTINICWSGSEPSNQYLENIEEVFFKLKLKYKFKIHFIFLSNIKPSFINFNDYHFVKWDKRNERQALMTSHIGLMPLPNNEFAKAKCGFKLILYGAYGLALVASPVGINNQIIQNNKNGFLVTDSNEWIRILSKLIDDNMFLKKYMCASKESITKNYSLENFYHELESILINL